MGNLSASMSNNGSQKLRGIKQFWAVFNIVKEVLPESRKSETLRNTHDLIKILKKKKYIDPNYEEYEAKPDYLSCDVVDFLENHQEKNFRTEYSRMQDDYDENNQARAFYQYKKLNNLGN